MHYNDPFQTPMNDHVRLLFHELSDLSPDEREQALAQRQIEPEVRAELESLLNHDSPSTQGFTACIAGAAGDMLLSAAGRDLGNCGPYRLVRLLGRGGMGAVYLGERDDGEIQQKVAVKLLSAEGDRPGWRERFLKERQLLASLNHPSIVRVMDAGHTDDGSPFLIMEHVEGTPIDFYSSRIPVRDRLILFLRVCDAVSHAHSHLVIHRDLKPSNILVDVSGVPKLLDFGIARLLEETGDATQTMELLLTPAYASPEQIRGTIQTTATDIYSLGAILYKLLTGRSPHESASGALQAIDIIAGKREIEAPSRVNPDLAADLDYIAKKALRVEPEGRYPSVEAFASDIRAFLEFRPVEARSGNAWYRARKFLRRYWLPLAAAALVTASLSAGLYLANRERVVAERRFQQLRQLSNRVFDLDKAVRTLPGSTDARQRLVMASMEYLEGLASDASLDLDLSQEIAAGYERVASIQGVPTTVNLGDFGKAEETLKKGDTLIERVLLARPQSRNALLTSALISHDRMILAEEENRRADALAHAHKTAERAEALLHQKNVSDDNRSDAAFLYSNISLVYSNMHMYEEAAAAARRTVELARPIPSAQRHVLFGLSQLAQISRYHGDLEGALQSIREAHEIADRTAYASEYNRMGALNAVLPLEGRLLGEDGGINLGRPAEGIALLQRAFDITEDIARRDPSDYSSRSREANIGNYLADMLRHQDAKRALAVYDLSIRRLGETLNNVRARRDQAKLLASSSHALTSLRRPAEAKQRIDAAFAILRETKDYPAEQVKLDSEAYAALVALADYYTELRDLHRAVETYEQLLDKVMASKPEMFTDLRLAPRLSRIYEALGRLCRQTGENPKANSMAARRLELWQYWDRKLPNNSFVQRQLQSASLPEILR